MQALGVGVDPDRDQQLGRMSAAPGAAFDRACVGFEAGQVEPLDRAPDLARRMLRVDQAFDIERVEQYLVAIEGDIARCSGVSGGRHL